MAPNLIIAAAIPIIKNDASLLTKRQESSGALSGPCDAEGIFNCIDGATMQQCASGQWSPASPVAPGTQCTVGQSADPGITATGSQKRQDTGALSGPCDAEGIFNCIDGATMQQCASGQWSPVSPVAPGTQCAVGQSTDPGITAAGSQKRQDAASGPQTGPCDSEGIYNCIGGTSFQRCASGLWSATLSVAPGTSCKVGLSVDLGITALAAAPAAKRQDESGALSGPCDTEGIFNCIDGASFQQCASGGQWSPATPMADGATCTPGQSEDLGIANAQKKRQDESGALSGECDTEGIFNCIDGASFQQCASGGQWSLATPMAAGSTCTPGQSEDLGVANAQKKRQDASGALSGACENENIFNCIDGTTFQQCASGEWTAARPMSDGTTCTVGQSEDLGIGSAA